MMLSCSDCCVHVLQVLSEISQLRNGWSQAKQIIKQQRKTIKAHELQLQLMGTPVSWAQGSEPQAMNTAQQPSYNQPLQQPQQQVPVGEITSWVLQRQQQQQQVPLQHSAAAAAADATTIAGSTTASTLAGTNFGSFLRPGAIGMPAVSQAGLQREMNLSHAAAGLHSTAGTAGGAAGLRQPAGVANPQGIGFGSAEQQQAVLSRTSELLQCTDDILKSLRARAAQC